MNPTLATEVSRVLRGLGVVLAAAGFLWPPVTVSLFGGVIEGSDAWWLLPAPLLLLTGIITAVVGVRLKPILPNDLEPARIPPELPGSASGWPGYPSVRPAASQGEEQPARHRQLDS